MALRRRQQKRILIILGAAVLLGAAAFGAYRWRQMRRDAYARDQRDVAIRALEAGDYETALRGFASFIRRLGDTEATSGDYRMLAQARRQVPLPNHGHLADAIRTLQYGLQLDAHDRETQRELLDLYRHVQFRSEALDLTETMLAATPDDVELLETRCDLLASLGRFDAALRSAESLIEQAPDHFPGYLLAAGLRLELDQPFGDVAEWVDRVDRQHGPSASVDVLRAFVFTQYAVRRGDDPSLIEAAQAALDRAMSSAAEITETETARALVRLLEIVGRQDQALEVLEAGAQRADPELRLELVRRLWYRRRPNAIVDLVVDWDAAGTPVPDESRALAALIEDSMDASSGTEEGGGTGRRIGIGSLDAAWKLVVEHPPADGAQTDENAIGAVRDALLVSPTSPLLHHWLGCVTAAGDINAARTHWQRAADLAPAWGEPTRRIADSYLGSDAARAVRLAETALSRSNGDPQAAATLADAWIADSGNMSAGALDDVRERLAKWRSRAKGTLGMRFEALEIALIAAEDGQLALDRLAAVADAPGPSSEETLLQFARLAVGRDAALASRFLDASESAHGPSPRLALFRGVLEARSRTPAEALRAYDRVRERADTEEDALGWQLARATLQDALAMPEAGEAWVALADANPDALSVQLGCLGADRAWEDADAIARVIERVERLAGPESSVWRIARGWLILRDPEAGSAQLAQVVSLMSEATRIAPNSVDAHVGLAQALERVGKNLDRAETEYRLAAELRPNNVGIELALARLHVRQGRSSDASALLQQVLSRGGLAEGELVEAAVLLAAQGEYRSGTDLLAGRFSSADAPRSGLMVLAGLYAQLGEYDRALEIWDRLLQQPDPMSLERAAGLFGELGRMDEARALIGRMSELGAPDGRVALARARLEARWGSPDSALEAHRRLVDLAPRSETAWAAWLVHVLGSGDAQALDDLLGDPRGDAIDVVAFVRDHRELVTRALASIGSRALVIDAVRRPEKRAQLLAALETVVGGGEGGLTISEVAPRLQALATADPDLISLQILAAEAAARASDLVGAVEIARRASERFPTNVVVARQLALLLASSGRWGEAVEAGSEWQQRAGGSDAIVDAFIANAMTQEGRFGDALAYCEVRLDAALADPGKHSEFLAIYGLTLVRAGRVADARSALGPLVSRHEAVRAALLGVDVRLLGSSEKALQWLALLEDSVDAQGEGVASRIALRWATAYELFGGAELEEGAAARVSAVGADADVSPADLFMVGYISERRGDAAAAEAAYRRALEIAPGDVACRNNLACLLAGSGRGEEAVKEAMRALEVAPTAPDVLDTVGIALRAAGRPRDARTRFEQALSRAPRSTAIMLNLAETLVDLDDRRAAKELVVRIVALEEANPALDEPARERLTALRDALR